MLAGAASSPPPSSPALSTTTALSPPATRRATVGEYPSRVYRTQASMTIRDYDYVIYAVRRYTDNVVGPLLSAQMYNPEFDWTSSINTQDNRVAEVIDKLRHIRQVSARLRRAGRKSTWDGQRAL